MHDFLKRCKKVKISVDITGNNDLEWLKSYDYFYIAYDGTCFDMDGYTICNFGTESPSAITLSKDFVDNFTTEVN